MAVLGGNRWSRAIALLLVLASSGIALGACEYQDDSPAPAVPSAVLSPSASPPVPKAAPSASPPVPKAAPSAMTSPPVLPSAPKVDPTTAQVQARNGAQLDSRLGLPPDGLVLGGSGGLGNDGFRLSAPGIPKGSYAVTAECVGVLKASLTIFQPDRRGGTTHELALDCGTTASAKLDLEAGPVSVHITRMTTAPGRTAVAGLWMAPAA
ncbi:hypothetical protein QF036_001330 [Arthrobacter globiformis]|nr:hypothetical protein [Arthrobacter globiformis]